MSNFIGNVVASVVGGILLALIPVLWSSLFEPLWSASHLALIAFGLLCLIGGLLIGYVIGWQVRKRQVDAESAKAAAIEAERQKAETDRQEAEAERERARVEAQAKADLERKASAAADRIRHMEYEGKLVILKLYDGGHRDWGGDSQDVFYDCPELEEFVDLEPVGSYMDRRTLQPWAREIIDNHPELLEPVRKRLKEEEYADFAEYPWRYGDKLPHCALVALDAMLTDSRVRMVGSAESEAVQEGIDYLIEHGVVGEDAISPSASVYVICPAWQRYLDDCGHDEVRAAIAAREYAHDAYGTELE